MWKRVFLFPGQVALWFFYMFGVSRSSTRALSSRWKNSQVMTVLFSLGLWILLFGALASHFLGDAYPVQTSIAD